MRIFLSAGEPSGDLHGSNLIKALQRQDPNIECTGFGGERMEAAGCHLLFPLCQFAVVGLFHVLAAIHRFLGFYRMARRHFREHKPDAVVLIDFPGFNWWIARCAKAQGIPVYYFVPPQLWGWASWRINKMRRLVDEVLTALPFEDAWYRQQGMTTFYMGHPYFDALDEQTLDWEFMDRQGERPGSIVGLLPGSRSQEVAANLKSMVRAAARIHTDRPDTRFLVACFKQSQYEHVVHYLGEHDLPYIEPCLKKTPEIIALAYCSLTVSGSVSLELLHQGKPFAVLYRIPPAHMAFFRMLKRARFVTLTNLLADRELSPEYVVSKCPSEELATAALRWLNDREAYIEICRELVELRDQVAVPGACDRAASYLLSRLKVVRQDKAAA